MKSIRTFNEVRRWLCLDCGKDTFEHKEDWYLLRNRLWRQLVPRELRHGMICRTCIEGRLGRPLTSDDFRKATDDESAPEDQPMREEDYGIIDSLTPEMLQAIDSAMIGVLASRPHKVVAVVRHIVEESTAAVPGLPDWFYMDRIAELIEAGSLIVVTEGGDLRFHVVTVAGGLPYV
jgi:hypothetical protein